MREVFGDIWELESDGICITTNGFVKVNGECVMGRGIAAEAKKRFPTLPKHLGTMIHNHGNHVFPFLLGGGEDEQLIYSFPVKHNWWEMADTELIRRSARELMKNMDKIQAEFDIRLQNVLLPRPGCGNGGLNWKYVKPEIENILDDRVAVVTWQED